MDPSPQVFGQDLFEQRRRPVDTKAPLSRSVRLCGDFGFNDSECYVGLVEVRSEQLIGVVLAFLSACAISSPVIPSRR